MRFHNDHTPGELIERIDGDVTELATFFSQFALNLVSNGLLLIGILVALFLEDWRAGLAFTIYLACHHSDPWAVEGYCRAAPEGAPPG